MSESESNPFAPPQVQDPVQAAIDLETSQPSCRREKLRMLAWMLVVSALAGLFAARLAEGHPGQRALDVAFALVLGVLLLRWCRYDCIERGWSPWGLFAFTLVICPGPLITMPIYFFASRGLGRGLFSILKSIVFAGMMIACGMAGAALGLLTADGLW